MTKLQHTPGPWTLLLRSDEDGSIPVSDGSKSSPLAYVSPRPFYEDTRQTHNARLIAAAPDLFAICREIAGDSRCDLVDSERRIRLYAALTKAAGESPSSATPITPEPTPT